MRRISVQNKIFVDAKTPRNPRKFESHENYYPYGIALLIFHITTKDIFRVIPLVAKQKGRDKSEAWHTRKEPFATQGAHQLPKYSITLCIQMVNY